VNPQAAAVGAVMDGGDTAAADAVMAADDAITDTIRMKGCRRIIVVLLSGLIRLMPGLRAAIPQASPLAKAEFATIRDRSIKIGAPVERKPEHERRSR
jgi:hypothetical protein